MRQTALTFLYLFALAAGCYSAFRPTFDSAFTRTQTDTGDSMLNHYILEHGWRAVSDPGYCGSLASPPFFHPEPHVFWYSETFLGAAPIYWALRAAMPYDLAFQWWQILCTGLNFVTFALVARWLRCHHIAAIAGAYFWAFAVVHIHQGTHEQLIPRFWMPIAVYHAWHFVAAPSVRSLNRTFMFAVLQAVTCVHTGWFLAFGLAVFVGAAVWLKPGRGRHLRTFLKSEWRRVALVTGLWGLTLSCFFVPYLVANQGIRRDYGECIYYLPTWAAWFKGPPGSRWFETLEPVLPSVHDESYLFCGFAFYLLVLIAGVQLWRHREGRERSPRLTFAAACLATAAVWWLLTLNVYGGVSAWWLVRFLPGGGAIRCVSRVCLIIDLFAVLGAMVWLTAFVDSLRPGWRRLAVLGAVAGAIIFEQTGFPPRSFSKDEFYPEVKRYAAAIRGADAAFIVPKEGRPLYGHILAMWAGLEANVPVVNGYSGRKPANYPYDFEVHPKTYSDDALRGWLSGRFRGTVVVLDPAHPDRVHYVRID